MVFDIVQENSVNWGNDPQKGMRFHHLFDPVGHFRGTINTPTFFCRHSMKVNGLQIPEGQYRVRKRPILGSGGPIHRLGTAHPVSEKGLSKINWAKNDGRILGLRGALRK